MNFWKNTSWQKGKTAGKGGQKAAFTLPEVIVSFSILAMVITSAVGLLTVVIRTNSDNVNSLVANGLAQEGIEAVRFIRDSNHILGLDFDGTKGSRPPVWGEILFDKTRGGTAYFTLLSKFDPATDCDTTNLDSCLPVVLRPASSGINDQSLDDLVENDEARVYLRKGDSTEASAGLEPVSADFNYYQLASGEDSDVDARATQYSRVIRVEALKSSSGIAMFDVLRVSSIVTWRDNNGQPKKLVLTTDLTDWK